MPLAFSTLGAPGASLAEVIDLAQRWGAEGVELRVGDDQLLSTSLSASARQELASRFEDAGIRILTAASYVRVCRPGSDVTCQDDLAAMVDLAASVGARYVRVFPGAANGGNEDAGIRRLTAVAQLATDAGVEVLLETHDSHPKGSDIARVLSGVEERVARHPFGAIWDVMHPWRAGETPKETLDALSPWLRYGQFKDADLEGNLVAVGSGAIPLGEIAALLPGRDRWWSFEWERAWHEHLAPLDEALPIAADWYRATVRA